MLFTETGSKDAKETQIVECIDIKPHKRNKKGRKPIPSHIPRREKIIDIPESEKTCDCGAKLTRIVRNPAII
jgi:hypothetical protein